MQHSDSVGTSSKRTGSPSRITSTMETISSWTVSPRLERRRGRNAPRVGLDLQRAGTARTPSSGNQEEEEASHHPCYNYYRWLWCTRGFASDSTRSGPTAHEATGYAESSQRCPAPVPWTAPQATEAQRMGWWRRLCRPRKSPRLSGKTQSCCDWSESWKSACTRQKKCSA